MLKSKYRVRSLLLLFVATVLTASSFGQLAISVSFAPPALPVYEQPLCPSDGYLWAPGYWAYDADDYYWVPGTWVMPPEPGLFWTPGYWAWGGQGFQFYDGYWAPQVGFYGGINYGYGYFGEGYQGGRWDQGHFFYNRSVNNVNVTNIHNVYNTTVINNTTVNRVSYNGGNGGIAARPRPEEEAAARERHIPPVAAQVEHVRAARTSPELRASTNRGKPPVAATEKPGDLRGGQVVAAKEAGAPYNPDRSPRGAASPAPARDHNGGRDNNGGNDRSSNPGVTPNDKSNPVIHARDLPQRARPEPPNSGNAKADQRVQQQQEKLAAQQEKEQQRLAQKQEQDHQKLTRRNADEAGKQQVEQKHQQQTQQLQQKHEQQQQRMQQRVAPQAARSNRPGGPEEHH